MNVFLSQASTSLPMLTDEGGSVEVALRDASRSITVGRFWHKSHRASRAQEQMECDFKE
jgi:hypothetical protein